jgi:hypothetical protein
VSTILLLGQSPNEICMSSLLGSFPSNPSLRTRQPPIGAIHTSGVPVRPVLNLTSPSGKRDGSAFDINSTRDKGPISAGIEHGNRWDPIAEIPPSDVPEDGGLSNDHAGLRRDSSASSNAIPESPTKSSSSVEDNPRHKVRVPEDWEDGSGSEDADGGVTPPPIQDESKREEVSSLPEHVPIAISDAVLTRADNVTDEIAPLRPKDEVEYQQFATPGPNAHDASSAVSSDSGQKIPSPSGSSDLDPAPTVDNSSVLWSYRDASGKVQGTSFSTVYTHPTQFRGTHQVLSPRKSCRAGTIKTTLRRNFSSKGRTLLWIRHYLLMIRQRLLLPPFIRHRSRCRSLHCKIIWTDGLGRVSARDKNSFFVAST